MFKNKFNNAGRKLKKVANVIFWILFVAFVIEGIAGFIAGVASSNSSDKVFIAVGLVSILLSYPIAWLSSISMYCLGEAAENSTIAANLAAKADTEREQEKKNA